MAKLIATKRQRYGTRELRTGDAFEASDKDARVLKALKRATPAPDSAPPKPRPKSSERYSRKDMRADDVSAAAPQQPATRDAHTAPAPHVVGAMTSDSMAGRSPAPNPAATAPKKPDAPR